MIRRSIDPAYYTEQGAAYIGDSRELLTMLPDNSVNLVMTSPPFALLRPKEYGNLDESSYISWFLDFARLAHQKLTDTGSFVVDFGGAYSRGVPTRSLYNYRVLIGMVDQLNYFIAQEFFWFNPAKLPSPIEWVNKRKIRVKDSVNTVWWFSKTEWPKADVSNVLVKYSERMKTLLRSPDHFYSPKTRPSGHDIARGFEKDNGGAIPPNLLQIANTESNSAYQAPCRAISVKPHPARFPTRLPEFFVRLLTQPGDVVLDIFAGSNTTGHVAETMGRRWVAFEESAAYVAGSALRFLDRGASSDTLRGIYDRVIARESIALDAYFRPQCIG